MLQKYFENGKETLLRFGWIETPPFHSRDCERTICLDDKPPIPQKKIAKKNQCKLTFTVWLRGGRCEGDRHPSHCRGQSGRAAGRAGSGAGGSGEAGTANIKTQNSNVDIVFIYPGSPGIPPLWCCAMVCLRCSMASCGDIGGKGTPLLGGRPGLELRT